LKNDRLFQMVYILLEKGSVTAPELASTLEVSVRTVYRDVEALSMAGVPVYASQGKGGGISLMPNYSFDKALLSDDEQNQILFAIQSLQATDQPVGALLKKLGGMFQKQNVSWIEADFSRWGMGRVDNEKFERLKTAILEKRVLEILYCSTSGETNKRSILPFKLIFKDKSWYLQAFCRKADDYRLFKVNRIVELEVTNERFTESFDDAPPMELDMLPVSAFKTIRLRFSPAVAFRVYDEFDRRQVTPQADSSMIVETALPADDWVAHYLFSFGTEVEILSPPELKQELEAYAKRICEHYKT
jgi:predicted DNA-binding transcriptional regulator YafY